MATTQKSAVSTDTKIISKPNILELIDFCKGFLMLWIVYFHFHKGNGIGWQGVHPFIVFSGFGLTYSCLLKKDQQIIWKEWFLKRLQRILPAYWLVSFIGFLLAILNTFHQQNSCSFSKCFIGLGKKLFFEVTFIKTLSYEYMWSLHNLDHLWFIPLIISFYAIFPLLFKSLIVKGDVIRRCVLLFAIAVFVEFTYRFIAIYLFDGMPIGYENSLFMVSSPNPLEEVPQWFPFQLQMPFGLLPSRIGEFVLGMLGAVLFLNHRHKLDIIFSKQMVSLGFFLWILGGYSIYINRFSWTMSDLLISSGLVLLCVNLASVIQRFSILLFSTLSRLGIWSYYIYLTHNLFKYLWNGLNIEIQSIALTILNIDSMNFILAYTTKIILLTLTAILILLSSWILIKFDHSIFAKWLIKNTVARLVAIM